MPMARIRRNVHPIGSLVAGDSHGVSTDPSPVEVRTGIKPIIPVVEAGSAGCVEWNESQSDKFRNRFYDS